MNKRATIIPVILAILLVAVLAAVAIFSYLSFNPATQPGDGSNVKPDDIVSQEGGMEANPKPDDEGNTDPADDYSDDGAEDVQTYTLQCRFEGKMDENSFEATKLDTDAETGETIDGPLVQMRVGNDSVREDVNILEIGETITVVCKYNEDSQLVAEKITLLGR